VKSYVSSFSVVMRWQILTWCGEDLCRYCGGKSLIFLRSPRYLLRGGGVAILVPGKYPGLLKKVKLLP
jgi:hypothetical protein